jgi:hypothetical protein
MADPQTEMQAPHDPGEAAAGAEALERARRSSAATHAAWASSSKEVRERCFRVNARLAFDYWLSRRCVAAVRDGKVLLATDKRGVADYLVESDCLDDDTIDADGRGDDAVSLA